MQSCHETMANDKGPDACAKPLRLQIEMNL